jgi:hypothetical protein
LSFVSNGGKFKVYTVLNGLLFQPVPSRSLARQRVTSWGRPNRQTSKFVYVFRKKVSNTVFSSFLWKIENCEISKSFVASVYNNFSWYQGNYCSSNVAKDVETWEVFSYQHFRNWSLCKYNLVEKIFATRIIKM